MLDPARLARLDQDHVWHPFTPMRQWAQTPPVVIERGEGPYLFDTAGQRYIDGVSSLWCNVHGHRVPEIDEAIRAQLDRIAHSTLLGLASVPSIELAAELVRRVPGAAGTPGAVGPAVPAGRSSGAAAAPSAAAKMAGTAGPALTKVFYSDAGATALEVAFKMAVGYWHHTGQPGKQRFIGLRGAYHGDTTGAMSVGYSDLFHRPFAGMAFPVTWMPAPDALRLGKCQRPGIAMPGRWPSEDTTLAVLQRDHCLAVLDDMLAQHADQTAAIVIEPVMQGAAGMICQPPGFLHGVAELARRHEVLLIADEVATGFGRTGRMFACEHEGVTPDVMCVAKGLTAGYLPLAATLATQRIFDAFCGELSERKTLYHGHTYTGNALACAAALASLRLFDSASLLDHIARSAAIIADRLNELRDARRFPHVIDIRQRGIMVGIELGQRRQAGGGTSGGAEPFDFTKRTGAALCQAMRPQGLIIRPLGDVLVLVPIPAMAHEVLERMLDIVVGTLARWGW